MYLPNRESTHANVQRCPQQGEHSCKCTEMSLKLQEGIKLCNWSGITVHRAKRLCTILLKQIRKI